MSNISFAQEVIVDFKDRSLPILNEELKSIRNEIRNISLSSPSGIIDVSDGGTGADLSSADDYSIFYMDPTGTFGFLIPGSSGQILTTNGTLLPPSWEDIASEAIGEIFLADGTFTAPAGVSKVLLTMTGGGAGGGGNSGAVAGGGGGAAEGVHELGYTVTAGGTYAVVIGAGGAGGSGAAAGTDGGNTIFNNGGTQPITVLGGKKGVTYDVGGATSGFSGANTAAGTGQSGVSGGAGGVMSIAGGAGGTGGNGNPGGGGGSSILGAGGTGGSGGNPGSANGFGAGGGGSDGGTNVGGSGTNGIVIIRWGISSGSGSVASSGDDSVVTLKVGGSIEQTGTFTMDFNGSQFSSTESPTGEENISIINLSGSNTGDQTSIVGITGSKAQFDTAVTDGNILYVGDVDLSTYVVGPASATDNAVARFNLTTGKLIQNSGVTIADNNHITTTGSLSLNGTLDVGAVTTAVNNADATIGVSAANQKGLVIQTKSTPTQPAFEVQDSTGRVNLKMETTGNNRLIVSGSGTPVSALFSDFVLSIQSTDSDYSWLEILNNGGQGKGAFFGLDHNQFQLFNWQGGDTQFWTHPNASDGYPRLTIAKEGNIAIDGTDQYAWVGGYGGGVGVLAIRNAKTVPTTSVADVGFIYADAGSLWTMDSDTTKTRLGTRVVALTDGATPALNAKLGDVFTLSAAGDRTIAVPSNPISGQRIIIRHTASGGNRTLALNTGAGGFRFGTSITGLTITTSGLTDYIECVYNATASKWDVINYQKGF